MKPRDILLRAADHIEQHPQSYRFSKTVLPTRSEPTGCLIGWMAHCAGHWSWFGAARADGARCKKLIGVDEQTFFNLLRQFSQSWNWSSDPFDAVLALRCYANTYHPDPSYADFRAGLDLSPLQEKEKVCGGDVT